MVVKNALSRPPAAPTPAILFILAVLTGVVCVSRYALLTFFLDGTLTLLVLAPPILAGLWFVPLLHQQPLPTRWHILLGTATGLGTMSIVILLAGLAGVLQRPVWIVIQGLLLVAGLTKARSLLRGAAAFERGGAPESAGGSEWTNLPWLLIVPFACLAILAAANAPGLIWSEEGLGYDVLEYHLQLPKEYFQSGRISYAPHNVYSGFPAGVEMFYLLAMILSDNVLDSGTTANLIHLAFGGLAVFAAWVAGRERSHRAGMVAAVAMGTAGWLCYLSGLAYVENAMLFFGMAATACLFKTDAAGQAEHPAHSRARLRWTLRAGAMAGFACACKYTALILIAMPLSVATLILPARSTAQAILRAVIFTAATVAAFSPWMLKNQIMTGNPLFPLANTAFDASPEGWGPDCTKLWERSHSPSLADATIRGKLWSLGNRIAGDHYQRFGPLVLLLPFVGLLRRPRDRVDAALLVILLIQTAAWCFLTHLYARFAVALLIPLVLLCGRSVQVGLSARRAGLIAGALVIGTAWNFFFAVKLHRAESPEGAPASWFYDGELPGYEYFKAVNQELPEDSKFLMIGDARAFYFKRPVDYCVVFNRNPFVEAIRSSATDADVYGWLHGRGYTHLLVNWGEVNRLRDTYGFPPEIAPVLFEKLQAAGLSVSREFPHPTRKGRYVTLYSMN